MNLPIEKLIQELSRPSAWPHPVDSVEVRQTHISIIYLAGDTVFKIKKPVDFGFLDFTTLQKRRHFCEEEVYLNRRLSPDVYMGVLPVTEGPGGLRFGGSGEPVEYAVRMRRLDESTFLSTLLEKGSVTAADMRRVAEKIADFHKGAQTSEEITRIGGRKAVRFNTEENFQQIESDVGDTLSAGTFERISDYTKIFLKTNGELFDQREAEGWIRDGHGDLHTQHISLAESIRIFDCIEFNQRFRYGDILSDAAFLVMDLERLGFRELAEAFRAEYLQNMGQEDYLSLLNFYACYRAVVRGKVEGFRSRDPNVPKPEAAAAAHSARTFHLLAEKYARALCPPTLIVACGLMGSGKSTCAHGLKEFVDIEILSSDQVRKQQAGLDPSTTRHVPFGTGIYSSGSTDKTYRELHSRAGQLLADGRSVFLDASYMDPARRADALSVASKAGVRALFVHFEADREVLINRLRERVGDESGVSDGREEILAYQMGAFQAPGEIPGNTLLSVDTTKGSDEAVRSIYYRLLSTTWSGI